MAAASLLSGTSLSGCTVLYFLPAPVSGILHALVRTHQFPSLTSLPPESLWSVCTLSFSRATSLTHRDASSLLDNGCGHGTAAVSTYCQLRGAASTKQKQTLVSPCHLPLPPAASVVPRIRTETLSPLKRCGLGLRWCPLFSPCCCLQSPRPPSSGSPCTTPLPLSSP